jgi:predicted MFS family arabinose efflux permease
MLAWARRLNPFTTPETRRLALLFAVVYFSQGMWYLSNQTITVVLKDRGLSAGQVAAFFSITTVPWLLKPVYGLVSDFVPLFGRRRKSYFLVTSALAAAAGFLLSLLPEHPYATMATLVTAMGFGLAFTDVLTDALMVEKGRVYRLTGAFQSVQWAAVYTASVLVGVLGGHFAATRALSASFLTAAVFPVVSFAMALVFVREAPARADVQAFRETWTAIRAALGDRVIWLVAGFIFFFVFSPSFGPALLYYQADVLGFSQHFIGILTALGSVGAVAGAMTYAPVSRRTSLRRIINLAIGLSVVTTVFYLAYEGPVSAVIIDVVYGWAYMVTTLAFLELAAKACPPHVEATFFALLTAVYNGGVQISQVAGGYLYDWLGYTPLVLISASLTALAWLLVPLVPIDRLDAVSRAAAAAEQPAALP